MKKENTELLPTLDNKSKCYNINIYSRAVTISFYHWNNWICMYYKVRQLMPTKWLH